MYTTVYYTKHDTCTNILYIYCLHDVYVYIDPNALPHPPRYPRTTVPKMA